MKKTTKFRNDNTRTKAGLGEWRMKGTMASINKRRENAISKRRANGETPKTSKKLAQLIDDLYNMNYVGRYHSQEVK